MATDESKSVFLQGESFWSKLEAAAAMHVDIWLTRKDKPNLSREAFLLALPLFPRDIRVDWEPKRSRSGPHCHHGEDNVFQFECEISLFGRRSRFYVKGYFYTKEKLGGVSIQSWRHCDNEPIPLRRRT